MPTSPSGAPSPAPSTSPAAVQSVLVIGAGTAGATVACLLAAGGVDVTLVESSADVTRTGSGITLQGSALRVLRDLGVWDELSEHAYAFDSLGIRAPDPAATLVAEIPDLRTGGPDLPATCGARRADVARLLLERADELGVAIRYSTTVTDLDPGDDSVGVTTSDGESRRYDLVIGADGIRSWTRRALGIELETRSTGMGIWRVYGARPESVQRTELVYGGRAFIAGYCPTSETTLYAYLVEAAQDRSALTPEAKLAAVLDLAASYHGPWDEIREGLVDPDQVNYTWFETHLLDGPWNRGRVVLAGDAVHACPPTIALGAALALEDAAVLAELLLAAETVDQGLFDRYWKRRYDRVRTVVDASVQIGDWQLEGVQGDVPGLMRAVSAVVSEPA